MEPPRMSNRIPTNSGTTKRSVWPIALCAFACLSVSLASCAAPATQPAKTLSPADAAVCELFPLILADFEAGYDAAEAVDRHLSGGWTVGVPSDQVRGAVNAYRSWVAAEQDEDDGFGTYDQSVDALAAAMRAQKAACGS